MKTLCSFLFLACGLISFNTFGANTNQCFDLFNGPNLSIAVSYNATDSTIQLGDKKLNPAQLREFISHIKSNEHLPEYIVPVKAKLKDLKKQLELFQDVAIAKRGKETQKLRDHFEAREKIFKKFRDHMKEALEKDSLNFQELYYFYTSLISMHEWFEHGDDYLLDEVVNSRIKKQIKNKDLNFEPITDQSDANPYRGVIQYLAPIFVEQKLSEQQWINIEGTGVYPIEYRETVTLSDGQRLSPQSLYNRDRQHLVEIMSDYLRLQDGRMVRRWLAAHEKMKTLLNEEGNNDATYAYYFALHEAPMRLELLAAIEGRSQNLYALLKQKMKIKLDTLDDSQIDVLVSALYHFIEAHKNLLKQ